MFWIHTLADQFTSKRKMLCPSILLKVESGRMRFDQNYHLCFSHQTMETSANNSKCTLSKPEKYSFYFAKTFHGNAATDTKCENISQNTDNGHFFATATAHRSSSSTQLWTGHQAAAHVRWLHSVLITTPGLAEEHMLTVR